MPKLSIQDLELKGKRLFIRVDFNVPLAPGGKEITSDKRIKAAIPTIQYALDHGAAVILASHLGRPKGKRNPEMSLAPCAVRLGELLKMEVKIAPDCIGPEVEAMLPNPGEVLLLENLRYHPQEEANDPEFSKKLAALCEVYVNDAFGTAHRAHASTVGMIAFVKQAGAGLLMEKELKYLTMVTQNPQRPSIAILGGAKVSDKIEVIENLAKIVDKLLIGGAMAYTFLKSQGQPVGKSLVENDKLELASSLLKQFAGKIVLPVDHVVAAELKGRRRRTETVATVPDGKMGLDIGAKTIENFTQIIKGLQNCHLERSHGRLRKTAIRQGDGRDRQGGGGVRRGFGSWRW